MIADALAQLARAAADAQQHLVDHAAARGVFLVPARYPRYVVRHAGANRAERRAAASPRVRPPASTPALRAEAARLRIAALHPTARIANAIRSR